MHSERERDDEFSLTSIQQKEENKINNNLRSISGFHKWIKPEENLHVEHINEPNKIDLPLQHFDAQLQVNDGQHEQIVRYGVFPTKSIINDMNKIKTNQCSQTIQPEMDTDHLNERNNTNGGGGSYSQGNYNNDYHTDSYRTNRQINRSLGGGGGNGNGDGSNPNRNNNHSRRPNDDDGDDGDDDDDDNDDDDDDETDENIARRLGFRPIDNHSIRIIGRIRSVTNKKSFDRRDFEDVQGLIDELINLQHLENSSQEHLERIIDYLKLYRILRTKSYALNFIQERLPRRQTKSNSNVFDIWREREKRSRLDSKDSLEDEGQNGQQTIEIDHSTSPIHYANNSSKVKQMAKHIDTRSEHHKRSPSPSPTNRNRNFYNETFVDDRLKMKKISSPKSSFDQRRVRDMVDRLESSSSTAASDIKVTKKVSSKQTYRDEHSNYSPPINDKNSNVTRFELDRKEILRGSQRTASGINMDDFVTSLRPNTETAISMVRDVRARIYEDDSAITRRDVENIPVKLDVETLYILEERLNRKSLSPIRNRFTPDYEINHRSTVDQHDFSTQTTSPTRPLNRPIATQVDTSFHQNTVGAQTTDSLHRPIRERRNLITTSQTEEDDTSKVIRTTTTTSRYEMKRRRSSHHTSEDEDNAPDNTIIYINDQENFQSKRHSITDEKPTQITEQNSTFSQVTSRINNEQLRDINRDVVRRQIEQKTYDNDEYHSPEVYEIHTRGACKCLVVSYDEKTQYGSEARFERQLKRIERTYTEKELKSTELHVIVVPKDDNYELVRREYDSNIYDDDSEGYEKSQQPTVNIHYYNKEGQRLRTEQARPLVNLPVFVRCEIEYELNHYGSAQLIILSVSNAERRQMNVSVKKETVDETVARTRGRLAANSSELENEISRQLSEQIPLIHLADYSSRDDYNRMSSTNIRRVSRADVSTSLRLVQRYRTVIHRLCQLHRSHLNLTHQAEQQRHLVLVAYDDYYVFDLASQSQNQYDVQERQHKIVQREVQNTVNQPFDYAKYRRDMEQQRRILEKHYRPPPPPAGHPSEAEFYLGSGRRELIEREIHSMRESIRPHDHAPPRYKHEPRRRSLSISYSGGQRYVRARIIHVRDYYDETQQQQQLLQQQQQQQQKQAKEQELFVRVDDYINEDAANTLRRSYSTDYLQEDGPRSRIRYIRIPGETLRIEEKTTYEYQGVMYTNLPYSLRYWNILNILDREAREGRALGSTLPHIIVNDPYTTVIPPLTQQEIRQTAQQVLSSQCRPRSYTDQTLRWFLSRDNRTEIETANYLQTLNQFQQQQQQQKQTNIAVQGVEKVGVANKYFVTEKLVRYEKMPDRLVPVPVNDRAQSIDDIHHYQHSPSSTSGIMQRSFHSQNHLNRSQSQPRPQFQFYKPTNTQNIRTQLPTMRSPLSRHQSVHDLHATRTLSHPPSPSPSLHSLHSNYNHQQYRRPVAYHNRFQARTGAQQQQNPLLTEIIDSQTGQRIVTTSQEQLPTEVLGLLNRYNLQQF